MTSPAEGTAVVFWILRISGFDQMSDMGTSYEQGLANRRVGATTMNSESSRSHSVFTCVIESRSKVSVPRSIAWTSGFHFTY